MHINLILTCLHLVLAETTKKLMTTPIATIQWVSLAAPSTTPASLPSWIYYDAIAPSPHTNLVPPGGVDIWIPDTVSKAAAAAVKNHCKVVDQKCQDELQKAFNSDDALVETDDPEQLAELVVFAVSIWFLARPTAGNRRRAQPGVSDYPSGNGLHVPAQQWGDVYGAHAMPTVGMMGAAGSRTFVHPTKSTATITSLRPTISVTNDKLVIVYPDKLRDNLQHLVDKYSKHDCLEAASFEDFQPNLMERENGVMSWRSRDDSLPQKVLDILVANNYFLLSTVYCGVLGAYKSIQPMGKLKSFLPVTNADLKDSYRKWETPIILLTIEAAVQWATKEIRITTSDPYQSAEMIKVVINTLFDTVLDRMFRIIARYGEDLLTNMVHESDTLEATHTASRTSTTSSSTGPCPTDELSTKSSPDCDHENCQGLNVEKKCTLKNNYKDCPCWLKFNVTGHPRVVDQTVLNAIFDILGGKVPYLPNCTFSDTGPMENALFLTAADVACKALGDFTTKKSFVQKVGPDNFTNYKTSSKVFNPKDYSFDFRWTQKKGTCTKNHWWKTPAEECMRMFLSFTATESCFATTGLDIETQPSRMTLSGKLDMECGIAEYDIHEAIDSRYHPKCFSTVNIPMESQLFAKAYATACKAIGDFTQRDLALTIENFGDYRNVSNVLGDLDQYNFEFKWTRSDGKCNGAKQWWVDPVEECRRWFKSFIQSPECYSLHSLGSAMARNGKVEFECGTAEFYIDDKSQDVFVGGLLDTTHVTAGAASCPITWAQAMTDGFWIRLVEVFCRDLGDVADKDYSENVTPNIWKKAGAQPAGWAGVYDEFSVQFRWQRKPNVPCTKQSPELVNKQCLNIFMAFRKKKTCLVDEKYMYEWGSVDIPCGTGWYSIDVRNNLPGRLEKVKDRYNIPYTIEGQWQSLNGFWKISTSFTWTVNEEDWKSYGGWRLETKLYDNDDKRSGTWFHYDKNLKDDNLELITIHTGAGRLSLDLYTQAPIEGEYFKDPRLLWFWHGDNRPVYGVARADGLMFQNWGYKDDSPSNSPYDIPFKDPLAVCNDWKEQDKFNVRKWTCLLPSAYWKRLEVHEKCVHGDAEPLCY